MMSELLNPLLTFRQLGGPLIWALFAVAFFMWLLIVERLLFIYWHYPALKKQKQQQWQSTKKQSLWQAQSLKGLLICELSLALHRGLHIIKLLISLCPLLGLLGTVTGMIVVFDSLSFGASSDAKALANGIYKATLPTMSGLLLALSGLYFSHFLQKKADVLISQQYDAWVWHNQGEP